MDKPVVFLFPGQGSQYPQMARSLFERDAAFATTFENLDTNVQQISGLSIIKLLYHSNSTFSLNRLLHNHLAIFMIQYSLSQSLIQRGLRPDIVLGTSLGEFAAATTAGILTPVEAVRTVFYQAQLTEETCLPGAMLAVLAPCSIYEDDRNHNLFQHCTLAGIQYHSNFLLSMPESELKRVTKGLTKLNIASYRLPVDFAFHSPLVEPIKVPFIRFLDTISIQNGHTVFIPCSTNASDKSVSRPNFWNTVREPILFEQAIRVLTKRKQPVFVDIGPSQSLANFVKQIVPNQSSIHGLLTPSHQDVSKVNDILSLYASNDSFLKR